jgi:hypothetical protein
MPVSRQPTPVAKPGKQNEIGGLWD